MSGHSNKEGVGWAGGCGRDVETSWWTLRLVYKTFQSGDKSPDQENPCQLGKVVKPDSRRELFRGRGMLQGSSVELGEPHFFACSCSRLGDAGVLRPRGAFWVSLGSCPPKAPKGPAGRRSSQYPQEEQIAHQEKREVMKVFVFACYTQQRNLTMLIKKLQFKHRLM